MLDDTTEVGMDGVTKALYKKLDASTANVTLNQVTALVRTPDFLLAEATNPDPYAEDVKPVNGRNVVIYRASLEHEKVRQSRESVMPDLYMSQEDSSEMSLLKTNVMDVQKDIWCSLLPEQREILMQNGMAISVP